MIRCTCSYSNGDKMDY